MILQLLVGAGPAVNRLAYVKDGTLRTMRRADGSQGTCDFTLVNYSIDDDVDINVVDSSTGDNYFIGHVRSRTYTEVSDSLYYCQVSCQSDTAVVGDLGAAPWNYSITPNYSTTFPYTKLESAQTSAVGSAYPGDVETTITVTSLYGADLEPGQTIDVVANVVNASDQRIQEISTTWLNKTTPLFVVKAGNPPIRLTTLAPNEGTFAQVAIADAEWSLIDSGTAGITMLGDFGQEIHAHEEQWYEIGGGWISFANSWGNYGSTFNTAAFRRDATGYVHLKGLIKDGTVGSSAFTLPAGWRPAARELCGTISNDAIGRVDVLSDGTVVPTAPSNNAYVSLDGITFKAGG